MLLDINLVAIRCAVMVVLSVALLAFDTTAASAQTIRQLTSSMNVTAAGNVDVVEELSISFPAARQRSQFFRVIPVWYQPRKDVHVVDVNVKNVVIDGKGPIAHKSWVSGREVYLKIGDQNTQFKGDHKIRIEYEILKGVQFINGNPRLYLSVTGEQCPFPVQKADVAVTLPKGTDLSRVKATSLVGSQGNWKPGAVQPGAGTVRFSAQNIKPAQGLTINIEMPAGVVVPHSVLYDWVLYLQKFYQIFVLPVATTIALSAWWWFYGRDQGAKKGGEANNWFPPEFVTPAEAGTLIDEHCDLKDMVSTLIDLAARGFINIRVLPYNGFIYLDNKDYEFTLLKSPKDRELKSHEQLFLVALFGGMSSTTYVSAIKGHFMEYLPAIKRRVYSNLVSEGLFARDPEVDRKNFLSVGAAVVTAGLGLMVASTYHVGGQATAAGTVLSGVILLLAARAMPKRTSKGVAALKQIRKFQHMVVFGNKKELEKAANDNPEAFSKYLAYAGVLGLAEYWASIFTKTVKDYPQWYQIDRALLPADFDALRFVGQLNDSMRIINRALTDPPYTARTMNVNSLTSGPLHSGAHLDVYFDN